MHKRFTTWCICTVLYVMNEESGFYYFCHMVKLLLVKSVQCSFENEWSEISSVNLMFVLMHSFQEL